MGFGKLGFFFVETILAEVAETPPTSKSTDGDVTGSNWYGRKLRTPQHRISTANRCKAGRMLPGTAYKGAEEEAEEEEEEEEEF